MEHSIGRICYWVGLVCTAVALVWRGLIAVHLSVPDRMGGVYYMSFVKAAALLLFVTIASASYAALKGGSSASRP